MEKDKNAQESLSLTLETWNSILPQYPLSINHLLEPSPAFIMGAALELFTLLGMNKENILYGPPEEDEHTVYYKDLIPIINLSRVLNHIMSQISNNFKITIFTIISPSVKNTQLLFRFLSNKSLFIVSQLEAMEPRVQELYDHKKLVEAMEVEHGQLTNQLNELAVSKACRGGRLKKVDEEEHNLNLELRDQTEVVDELKKKFNLLDRENEDLNVNIDKLNSQTDMVLMENERLQAQIVNDADEIKYRHNKAILEENDTIEQRDLLQDKLMAKESIVKNLQSVKENLEETKNLLDEITALAAQLNEIERSDSKDADLAEQRSTEQLEKEVAEYSEQREAERERQRRLEEQYEQEKQHANSEKQEALNLKKKEEMNCKEGIELSVESVQLVQALQAAIVLHEQERVAIMKRLKQHDDEYNREILLYEEEIKQTVKDVINEIGNKVKEFTENNRHQLS